MTEIVRVPFHGDEILTVDANGKPHIILKPAIEALGLNYSTQVSKLRGKSWATCVPLGGIQVPGQGQRREVLAVDVRTFLMLLATVDERRVSERARPKLVAYQAEVADVIEAYWTKGSAENPRATEVAKPRNQLDVLRLALDQIEAAQLQAERAEQEARVANARLDAIEGRHDYYAALGWAKLRGFAPTDDRTLANLGRIASTVGKASSILPGKAPHAHYGEVNTWPVHVWDEAARRYGAAS